MAYITPPASRPSTADARSASVPKASDDYILGRTHAANARLNLQHYLWREILGYSIHPSIPWRKSDVRIADVGTGTGQWLFELASELPSTAVLDGYDLDQGQTLPTLWRPSNVRMRTWDATTEPPEEGYYDIIQIRLFIFVIKGNDPRLVLNNLVRMLKPGGYIQWLEPDFSTLDFRTTDPSNPATALPSLETATTSSDPRLQPRWPAHLAEHFRTGGMCDVIEERRTGPPHAWFAYHSCVLMAREEVVANKVAEGVMGREEGDKLLEMVKMAGEESRRGASYVIERVCVVGRKPGGDDVSQMAVVGTHGGDTGMAAQIGELWSTVLETVGRSMALLSA